MLPNALLFDIRGIQRISNFYVKQTLKNGSKEFGHQNARKTESSDTVFSRRATIAPRTSCAAGPTAWGKDTAAT